jgi:uncharacterized membrane protein
VTAAWLLLTFGLCAVTGFIYYWAGVDSEAQRAKDDRRELRVLRERYAYMRDLNQELAHTVSDLQMRETFRSIVGEEWSR